MDDLDADGYDALLDRLAADAAGRARKDDGDRGGELDASGGRDAGGAADAADGGRDAGGAQDAPDAGRDEEPDVGIDALWGAVGDVVPELTDSDCRRVLELADSEPDAALVEEVTSHRDSDGAERLRARALTVLVADLRDRLEE